MNHDEWMSSPAGDAVTTFHVYCISLGINAVGGVVGSTISKLFNWLGGRAIASIIQDNPQLDNPYALEKLRTLFDTERDDAIRNGMMLVVGWSAFESCFKDFCRGVIVKEPSVLNEDTLRKLKIPLASLFADDTEKGVVALTAIEKEAGRRAGVDGFEDILSYLQLDGLTPRLIKDAIYQAQMIRHVWAHRFGIADASFVERAAHLGFSEGDLVSISTDQLLTYLDSLYLYMTIIANRHRVKFGLEPLSQTTGKRKGDRLRMFEAYNSLYVTSDSSPGTSRSESDVPPESPAPQTEEVSPTQTSSSDSTPDPTP